MSDSAREPRPDTVVPKSGVAAVDPLPVGSVVAGKYLVESTIGEGGIGFVVKAKHLQLDQPVAIKYLKPEAAARPDLVERFLREARLAAKIKNEHAVKVQDIGTLESGAPFMVMEFLEGRDLEQVVLEAPLGPSIAAEYVLQVCEALAEAHAAGIVHRDLKPANLFLTQRPGGASLVKVLDFGISRLARLEARELRVTRVDERVGTPAFMSPEQLHAAPDVDARSDIWALGVVLYELVTGRLPFEAEDLAQLCVAVLMKPHTPMHAVRGDVPLELEAIVARCLEKDRAARYQNVAELAQDLAQLWEDESPSRVQKISSVVREAGARIAAPTPFPAAMPFVEASGRASQTATAKETLTDWSGDAPAEDHVVAVFTDRAGGAVDELQFVSIDEAYEYACTLGDDVVRFDLYDAFADVRGRLRVTYVRQDETGHWVPLVK